MQISLRASPGGRLDRYHRIGSRRVAIPLADRARPGLCWH